MVIIFTDLAKDDLASIEQYTREKWGSQQADVYFTQIEDRILSLLHTPFLGVSRSDIADKYRCIPQGKHIIFYRVDGDIIYILGVPHASMDLEKHLE